MDPRNKILIAMGEAGHEAAMDAIRRYLVYNTKGKHSYIGQIIADITTEEVTDRVEEGQLVTDDGRPIYWWAGRAYVTARDYWERRLRAMHMDAQSRAAAAPQRTSAPADGSPPPPGEGRAAVRCPACSAEMAKAPICPNCALGKQGYKLLLTCTECGREVPL
jgi:hypothetical protein